MPELITLRDEDLKGEEPQVLFDELALQTLQENMKFDEILKARGLRQYQGQPPQFYQPGQIIIGQAQTFPQEGTLTGTGQTYTIGQSQQNIGNPLGGLFGGLTGSLLK